jgi:hypothetical protein
LVPELVQSATTSKVFDRLEVCNKIWLKRQPSAFLQVKLP